MLKTILKEGKNMDKQMFAEGGDSKKSNPKNKMVVTILLVVVLLVFVVGGTYAIAIFSTTSDANTVNTGSISMSYVEPTNALILENALPMSDEEGKSQTKYFEFTVSTHATTNEDDATGITIPYEINISDIGVDTDMSQLPKTAIKLNLSTVNGNVEEEVLSPKHLSRFVESSLREDASRIYKTSDIHKNGSNAIITTYRLRAWLDKNYVINNGDETKYQYKFRVNVNSGVNAVGVEYNDEYQPEEGTLAYAILGANNSNVVTSGDGLYKSTLTDGGEPTYYYKGNVENNYVSFANQTWRVVRINEDRSIRLIMEDGINDNTTKTFNRTKRDQYKYFYYSESNVDGGAMKILNDWYNANLATYDSKIATSTYCESARTKFDKNGWSSGNASMEITKNYVPNFSCPTDANGYGIIVNQKIGLITLDEAAMAGVPMRTGTQTNNTNTYLHNGTDYWTMSPAGVYDNVSLAYVWFIESDGFIQYRNVNSYLVLRPIISLNPDVVVTGTGESGNMWVVQ